MIQKLHIKPAGERIGISGLGWHAFRHSYRGLLDETGANAGMQKGLMRHANIPTTMNTYGRAAMKAKQEANSKVVQMILPRRVFALNVGFCGVEFWGGACKLLILWLLK